MNKAFVIELISILVTIALVLGLFNPFNFWMPMPTHIAVVATLLVSSTVLGYLFLKQVREDEREQKLRLFSYQTGYMLGITMLLVAIIFQSFQHQVDIWIVLTLIVMFGGKLCALGFHHKIH